VRLAYTLDLPQGSGPVPAIVAGHGSGRTRRQDLARFAAEWTRMGFAVLRFEEMYYSALAEKTTRPVPEVNALMPAFHGPSGYDPVPTLRELQTPALWLLGLGDRSIPIETTLTNLRTLAAGGKPFEWRTYEGLDHDLSPRVREDVEPWVTPLYIPTA
jgi:hypothetical protein